MTSAARYADSIYLDLARRTPGWLFSGLERVSVTAPPPLHGDGFYGGLLAGESDPELSEKVAKDFIFGPLASCFGRRREWFDALMDQTVIATAGGAFLELHARDRGTGRVEGESDASLRDRVLKVPDKVTDAALTAALHEVTHGAGEVFTLRYRTGFLDRGFADTRRVAGLLFLPSEIMAAKAMRAAFSDYSFSDASYTDKRSDDMNPVELMSCWNVAVAVLPELTIGTTVFTDHAFCDFHHCGDVREDAAGYRAIRKLMEERRAAGISVGIWVEEPVDVD